MTTYTHQTAPTQYVEARGIRFAYRRFGKAGSVPLVFNMHFIGTMDYWDPAVTDGLARDREVILFNNAGVSSSSGEVPTTFEEMATISAADGRACVPLPSRPPFLACVLRLTERDCEHPTDVHARAAAVLLEHRPVPDPSSSTTAGSSLRRDE